MAGKQFILSRSTFKYGSGWMIFLLGLFFYYLGYFQFDEVWKEISIKIADVLVIGVILGYLTSVVETLGVFKSELESVVYCKEHLSKRADINEIWENVSKQLFKSKFPAINKELLEIVQKYYFPVSNISYYNDYSININISWHDRERNLVKVTNVISFELISEETKPFKFPLKSWINVNGLNEGDYSVVVSDYLVNNRPAVGVEITEHVKDGIHYFEQNVELSGDKKYDVEYKLEKVYSLDKDFCIGFSAQYIIKKMTVRLTYPYDDIAIDFCRRGTIDEYKTIESRPGFIEKKYKGILLPRQGYIVPLKVFKGV